MTQSIDSIQNSALDGNPLAQYELGQMFEFGRGVGQDYSEAMEVFETPVKSMHSLNMQSGFLYEHGCGVEANASIAAEWYTKAANLGDTWAINNLAMLYSYGKGVPANEQKANDLYFQAANLGHFQAQYNLGARYASGRGFDVDLIASYFWFERSKLGASALNQERANKMIETISAHMTAEDLVIAQAKVQEIFKQPIDSTPFKHSHYLTLAFSLAKLVRLVHDHWQSNHFSETLQKHFGFRYHSAIK